MELFQTNAPSKTECVDVSNHQYQSINQSVSQSTLITA